MSSLLAEQKCRWSPAVMSPMNIANDERPTTASLPLYFHFVVRKVRTLYHRSAKLHHHLLLRQSAWQSKPEHSGIRIRQPVVFDQILGHDVGGKHRISPSHPSRIPQSPLGNQWQIPPLRRPCLHLVTRTDFHCVQHDLELRLHLPRG